MSIIRKIQNSLPFKALVNLQVLIMVITTILAAVLVFWGVFLRYILKGNFFGQEEILAVIAMWLYWMGGVYGTYEGSHIKGDMLSSTFKSPKAKKIIELLIQLVSFIVIAVFIAWGIEYMEFNFKFVAVSTGLKIPLWTSQLPLLVGFILMELYTAFNFFCVLLNPDFGKTVDEPAKKEDEQ